MYFGVADLMDQITQYISYDFANLVALSISFI